MIVSKPPRDSGRLVWKIRAVVVIVDTAATAAVTVAVAVDTIADTTAGMTAGIDLVELVGGPQAGLRIQMGSELAAGD
jgi:nitrogenase subunit NifH